MPDVWTTYGAGAPSEIFTGGSIRQVSENAQARSGCTIKVSAKSQV